MIVDGRLDYASCSATLAFSFSLTTSLSTPEELTGYSAAAELLLDAIHDRMADVVPNRNVNHGIIAGRRTVIRGENLNSISVAHVIITLITLRAAQYNADARMMMEQYKRSSEDLR